MKKFIAKIFSKIIIWYGDSVPLVDNSKYMAWLEKSLSYITNRKSAGVMHNYFV